MFKPEKNEELTNKIEMLLSGQLTLNEAKKSASNETREILDLVDRLSKYEPAADPSFRAELEKRLLKNYRHPRLRTLAFKLGFRRIRVVAAASLAALLLLSGMAMAIPGVRKLIVRPPSGNIEVISSPEKAKVFLDNTFKGTTPIRLDDIAAGLHELKVSKENHEDWSGAFRVKEKKTVRIVVELNEIEVIVVKPKRTAKANKSDSRETETPGASLSAADKSQLSQETPSQSSSADTSKEGGQNPAASPSNPPAAADSSANSSEPLPSSESLILSGEKALFFWNSPGKKETILDDVSGVTEVIPSPSGSMIVLVDSGALKVLGTSTKDTKLTHKASGGPIKNPRWSPDENALLFTAPDADSSKPTIFTVQISSKAVKKIAAGTIGSWSPTGQEIAFTKETGGIFLTDSEGNKEQQALPKMKVLDLKWSPLGIKIAFTGIPETESMSNLSLYLLNKDGTELKKIATGCTAFSWSPDGQSIVFEKSEKQETNIYVTSLEGANQTSIAKDAKSPRFSPDSKRIAFTKDDGIYIANFDGTSSTCVLQEPTLGLIGWTRQ